MASQWIKYVKGLHETPEVLQIAQLLNLDVYSVIGRLLRIWEYIDTHFECDLGPDDDLVIRHAAVTLGALHFAQPGAQELFCALEKVGWVMRENDTLRFVHWGRHNGKSAKARALAALRSERYRVRCASRSRHGRVTETSRLEKRREDNRTPPLPPPCAKGGGLPSQHKGRKQRQREEDEAALRRIAEEERRRKEEEARDV